MRPLFTRTRILRALAACVTIVVVLLGLALGIAMMIEDRFIYYPAAEFVATPDQFQMTYEELDLRTADGGRVHGWYITPEGEPKAYLLFSHGNGGNISGRLHVADELVRRGAAVLMYDYRGYGRSPGEPSEAGLYSDAEAALAALVERAGGPDRVVLYGRSLGGGVSWEMAQRHPDLAGIITDATFTSVPDMAGRLIPLPFIGTLVRTRMDNHRKVAEVDMPKLLMHGTDDELIPFTMGEELHAAAAAPVRFVPLAGAGHNNTMDVDPATYYGAIDEFLDELFS
jgi:uncharacterized protein